MRPCLCCALLAAWAAPGAADVATGVPDTLHTGLRARVRELDAEMLQNAVGKHRRFLVLMHGGKDTAVSAFQPWLYALANFLPHIPLGRVDLSQEGGSNLAEGFAVDASEHPRLKLFVRDNPMGKRIIDYLGPLDFEAMLGWARAAVNDEEHELSAYGVEPYSGEDEPELQQAHAQKQAEAGGAMSNLPESVRRMAQTMVRETRLQRILKQHGGGRVEQYDAMVQQKYAEIVGEESTDLEDKFQVQEANRRARDFVRDQLMADAPLHIREEVEADVNLGDAKKGMGNLKKGEGKKKKKKAKK